MKKILFALAAAASFVSAPAHATFWVHHGCGDDKGCGSDFEGAYTYDGNGGKIADLFWINPLVSTINVADSFNIADVNVSLNDLEHKRWGDMRISLTHGATTVWLSKNQGGGKGADGNYIFDDEAANLISNVNDQWKAGTYNPFGSLSDFNGVDSAGLWTLKIWDDNFNFKTGELCDWTLQLTPTSEVPEPATWAMMLAGFGLVGYQMRRRRGVPATVRA